MYQEQVSGPFLRPEERGSTQAHLLAEKTERGLRYRMIELQLGRFPQARLRIHYWQQSGSTKRPVLISQYNHKGWGEVALDRGWNVLLYQANDSHDDTQSWDSLLGKPGWPILMRRASAGAVALDWLSKEPSADPTRFCLTGHSRNGKQSLMLAAFDSRISQVLTSSAGTGGDVDWEFTRPEYRTEPVEEITRKFPRWFSPDLRRRDSLGLALPPVSGLMACLGERKVHLLLAENDHQAHIPGAVQTAQAAQKLNPKAQVSVWCRPGNHHTSREDAQLMLDIFQQAWEPGIDLSAHRPPSFETGPDWLWPANRGIQPDSSVRIKAWAEHEPYLHPTIGRYAQKNLAWLYIEGYTSLAGYHYAWLAVDKSLIGPKGLPTQALPAILLIHDRAHASGWRKHSDWIAQKAAQGYLITCLDLPGYGTRYGWWNQKRRPPFQQEAKEAVAALYAALLAHPNLISSIQVEGTSSLGTELLAPDPAFRKALGITK